MLFARMERKNDHKSVALNPTYTRIFVYEQSFYILFYFENKSFRIYTCGLEMIMILKAVNNFKKFANKKI